MQGFRIVGIKQEKEGGNLYKLDLNTRVSVHKRNQRETKVSQTRLRPGTLKDDENGV